MVYWRHKVTGVVVKLKENQKMIDTWERLTDFKITPKKTDDKDLSTESTEAKQVFPSVKVLKTDADTSRNAFTQRGAEYSFDGNEWKKVELNG